MDYVFSPGYPVGYRISLFTRISCWILDISFHQDIQLDTGYPVKYLDIWPNIWISGNYILNFKRFTQKNIKFCQNSDVLEYKQWNTMSLYATIPFMMGHNKEDMVGLFVPRKVGLTSSKENPAFLAPCPTWCRETNKRKR